MSGKGNKIAFTMFWLGAALAFIGLAGVIVLIVLFVKGRRKRTNLEREGIFEEIEQAENRFAEPPPRYDVFDDYSDDAYDEYADDEYEQPYDSQVNDYDPYGYEEDAYEAGGYNQGYNQTPEISAGDGPVMPMEVSMYTEEFDLDDHLSDTDEYFREAPASRFKESPISPPIQQYAEPEMPDTVTGYDVEENSYQGETQTSMFDTDEILREALGDAGESSYDDYE